MLQSIPSHLPTIFVIGSSMRKTGRNHLPFGVKDSMKILLIFINLIPQMTSSYSFSSPILDLSLGTKSHY